MKSGVGTAAEARSRVWFTMSHGILNEVYYPRVDQANTRDMGLIVTSGSDFFSEEKRDTTSVGRDDRTGRAGVPRHQHVARRTLSHREDRRHRSGAQRCAAATFTSMPLRGDRRDYRLYALLAPHIGNQGAGNSGWLGDYKGVQMLFAERDGCALALACSQAFAGDELRLRRHERRVAAAPHAQDAHRTATPKRETAISRSPAR